MIYDIAFYVLIIVVSGWLVWELIPEGLKKYWAYRLDSDGNNERITFIFRR